MDSKKVCHQRSIKKISTDNAVSGQDKDEAGAFIEEDYREAATGKIIWNEPINLDGGYYLRTGRVHHG